MRDRRASAWRSGAGGRVAAALAVAASSLAAAPALAGDPGAAFAPGLERELEERRFSGILDARGGESPLFSYRSGAAITPASVFWVGSVSKQFAAVAALRLVDQGRLQLDQPLAPLLGLRPGALALNGRACTLAQVLHHTCGLPGGNVCSFRDLDEASPQAELFRCAEGLTLRSSPGERYEYSNLGFDLVGVLVGRTARTSYGEFLERELFGPLGMRSTGVDLRRDADARRRLIQGEAFNGFGWSRTWPWLLLDPTGPGTAGASGNVFSTVEDLHLWNRALHGGRVLSAESYRRLTTPALDGYGLGLGVEKTAGGAGWLWHNGSLTPMGWSSLVAYVPSRGVSVVGLANRSRYTSHVMRAARAAVLAAAGEPVPAPALSDPGAQDLALEMLFFLQPLLLAWSVAWLAWTLVRGPRRGAARWVGTLLTGAALYLMAASLFDFYGRAGWLSPPAALALALGVGVHRARLEWSLRQTWSDPSARRSLLGQALAVGALALASEPAARLWLAVSAGCTLALCYALGRRRAAPGSLT